MPQSPVTRNSPLTSIGCSSLFSLVEILITMDVNHTLRVPANGTWILLGIWERNGMVLWVAGFLLTLLQVDVLVCVHVF